MLNQNQLKQIKSDVEEFFNKLTMEVIVEIAPQENENLPIKIRAEDPRVLIGERGQTLFDIQRLLGAMLKRKIDGQFYIDLDINDYKKKKASYLKETAQTTADEVSLQKRERYLQPMAPPERRIVHLELADRADVTTQSIGEEPKRRIVIRPHP